MKKKNLTINTLALGNLKQRRKQYIILIIGIILAMVFSSSTLFFLFSSSETYIADRERKMGKQLMIISDWHHENELYEKAVEEGVIPRYGLAHIIGYGYAEENAENLGTAIAWLDENAKEISNQFFIEGSYPQNENEIAIEQSALLKLDINAEIGDEITLLVNPQNSIDYLEPIEKTYTLTGIVSDKRQNIFELYGDGAYEWAYSEVPAAFVAQGTQTELGGKELLSAYIPAKNPNQYEEESEHFYSFFNPYFEEYERNHEWTYKQFTENAYNDFWRGYNSVTSIVSGGEGVTLIAIVLVFAACMAIVNAFSTNLKERKKQIGMLRAVGATKRQIIRIFGREALIISLICTPISIAISYGIVRVGISLISDKAIFTKSIWALPLSAVVCVAVTMLSALIPLLSATRITPMQAIRNIDITRKMRVKNIHSKKRFNVSGHLASRNSKLYRNGRIAVCVILTVTILFSCLGFSQINLYRGQLRTLEYDYRLYDPSGSLADYANYLEVGISEADKRDIENLPYFSEVAAKKKANVMLELEEFTDYHRRLISRRRLITDSFSSHMAFAEGQMDFIFNPSSEEYETYKSKYGNGNDIFGATIHSRDDSILKEFEDSLTAGKINLDKLSSGEEIILIAPQTAIYTEHSVNVIPKETYFEDEEINPEQVFLSESECPYKVGDKITLSMIEYKVKGGDENDYTRVDKEFTIGAIISPMKLSKISDINYTFGFLTTHAGMYLLSPNTRYREIAMNVKSDITIDRDFDEMLISFFQNYVNKYSYSYNSNYEYRQVRMEEIGRLYTYVLSVVLIGFMICSSIINNTVTASIRERKKEIGTLRAVGADIGVLVKSYIMQLLLSLGSGYLIGFAGYGIFWLIYTLFKESFENKGFVFAFSPWETLALSAILFAICSINLWSKIRKEMKNSIVENIREL